MSGSEMEAARAVAFRFLSHSARSRAEMERRLERGGFDDDITSAVILELEERGHLDDDRFASDWILDRADRKRYGKVRLTAELMRKGVESDTIKEAIGGVSEEDEIRRAMEIARTKCPVEGALVDSHDGGLEAERKLSQMLLRRGFNWSTVKQVLALRAENIEKLS